MSSRKLLNPQPFVDFRVERHLPKDAREPRTGSADRMPGGTDLYRYTSVIFNAAPLRLIIFIHLVLIIH